MLSHLDITTIPEDDSGVWQMIGEGRVKGCFQIESYLGKTWAKQLKPENINELAALISIIRPGTLKAIVDGKSMTQHFVDRKHKKEDIPSLHPLIDSILTETYGVIVYQEQAMEIAVKMARFTLKQADDLRKAIGKKLADLMKEVRVKFISGSLSNGISEEKAIEIFDMIEKSARYSFNKSHAVAYAKVAYWSAFLKYHHPRIFHKNWLRNADEKLDPDLEKKQLIMSARSEGIGIRGPSINVLEENFTLQGDSIQFGICNVKNVGQAHLSELKKRLDDLSTDEKSNWTTILFKVLVNINKRAIENLISVGTFSGFGKSRSEMLHEYHCVLELTDKEIDGVVQLLDNDRGAVDVLKKLVNRGVKKAGGWISTQNRLQKIENIIVRILNPGRTLVDNSVVYARIEEQLLGCQVNHSELNGCSDSCHANATCKEIADGKQDQCIIAAVIKRIKQHKTKNDDVMVFLSVEDDSGELDNIVVFPDVYEQNKDIMYERATVLISGQIKDKQRNSFVVDKIFLI